MKENNVVTSETKDALSLGHSRIPLRHLHILVTEHLADGDEIDTNTIRAQQWEKGISCPPIGWHEDSKAMECKTTCRRTAP